MSHLYLPWGTRCNKYNEGLQVRNQFASSLELHKPSPYEYEETHERQRSPSLPPIKNQQEQIGIAREDTRHAREQINRNIPSAKKFNFYDEDGEGDTSGYGSETLNMSLRTTGPHVFQDVNRSPVVAWQQERNDNRNNRPIDETADILSNISPLSLSNEEGRLRWGDRGVATGRLWEPTAANARLPQMQNQKKGTPSWVERGLNMIENTVEILTIDQRSSENSGFDCDRSSSHGSDEGRTFLRGQNVPIEPEIKAQRENKRVKALELQSAILSQLEDQQKNKQEEREKRLREERLEELRLQRQQEEDRVRIEDERQKREQRQMIEQKKIDTLKKALEDAERKAKQEKEKRFNKQKQNIAPQYSRSESNVSCDGHVHKEKFNNNESTIASPINKTNTYEVHSPQSEIVCQKRLENNFQQTTDSSSPRSIGSNNLNNYIKKLSPLLNESQFSIVPIGLNSSNLNNQQNGLQLAILVPQNIHSSLHCMSLSSHSINKEVEDDSAKVLTPRKFRNLEYKDASCQTDINLLKYTADKANETEKNEQYISSEYQNIDENAPRENHYATKKDRRLRSEERYKKDIDSRPKWGVNRPAAQYKKQSEKDPFYTQKRKLRSKHRPQVCRYLSQSSDESRSPTPPLMMREMATQFKRNSLTQSYWRKKRSNQDIFESINDVSECVNIDVGMDCNKQEKHEKCTHEIDEIKKVSIANMLSPSKRITLSQKFINDKYGNKKLWNDDKCDSEIENKKKTQKVNTTKKDNLHLLEYQDNTTTLM